MPKKKGGKKDKGPDPNNPFDMVMAQPEQILDLVATRQKLEASLSAEAVQILKSKRHSGLM
jgi:hypothetical protein